MKKLIISAIIVVTVAFAIITLRGMFIISKVSEQPASYKYVENLNGIGCLKIGMTSSEVKIALDSMYNSYNNYLKSHVDYIDGVRVKRKELLKLVKPYSDETPLENIPNYREYEATLIFSEDFAIDRIKTYFWSDTLYRIHVPNSQYKTKQVGEGLLFKYGDGIGHNRKDGNNEDQLHRWGNDKCIVTYTGRTTYYSDGPRWFYDVEVITTDLNLPSEVKAYLQAADSLWQAERDAAKYKNL